MRTHPFWLCSFWVASVPDQAEMVYLPAATRWQNALQHGSHACLPARQAGAVQGCREAAAPAEFLSPGVGTSRPQWAQGCPLRTASRGPRPTRCLWSLEDQGRAYDCSLHVETPKNVPADYKDLAQQQQGGRKRNCSFYGMVLS